jgi:hypothetical protein
VDRAALARPRHRGRREIQTRSNARRILPLALLLGACQDAIAPDPGGERAPKGAVNIAFVDSRLVLNTLRSGSASIPTTLTDVQPFAATHGALAFLARPTYRTETGGQLVLVDPGGLRLFHLTTGRVDTLPVPYLNYHSAGAISPDGKQLAFVSVSTRDSVFIQTVELATGHRDSLNVTGLHEAASQIAFSTPVYSPSGDSVAFLLPNPITVQLLIFEVRSRRVEVHPVQVRVTTTFSLLAGWPRWTSDAALRFVARGRSVSGLTDTLYVLKLFPRELQRPAEVGYSAAAPDSLPLTQVVAYSFDESGKVVAFQIASRGLRGLALIRAGEPIFQTLLYDRAIAPDSPVLVP